jgi:UDP-N-acetylglucosamine 1-carboxyvinyltransferase
MSFEDKKNLLKIPAFQKISGSVSISGAKNSALPIIAATILTDEEVILRNVPDLIDINVMLDILNDLGSKNYFDKKNNTVIIYKKSIHDINPLNIDKEKACKIRASSVFMGPLLLRKSFCIVFDDGGGCKIGKRLLDLHIKFLKSLGAYEFFDYNLDSLFLKARHESLFGNKYDIDFKHRVSVGATQNIIMAATLAKSTTIIRNAASEPEIIDLCNFLRTMGAKIYGDGTKNITIEGTDILHGCEYEVMSDRIETGSFLIASLMNRAEVLIENTPNTKDLKYFLDVLKKTGAEFNLIKQNNKNSILVKKREARPKAVSIETAPHPFFPTDLAQVYSSYMSISDSTSVVRENLFESRFDSTIELKEKMGANIKVCSRSPNLIRIYGVKNLSINHSQENPMKCHNLRGGMSLLCSGLTSEIDSNSQNKDIYLKDFEFIKRGYENFIEKFNNLGLKIEIV